MPIMGSSTTNHSDQLCRRCARMPCERERQPLFTTIPALAKMSKQVLHDTIGLILNPWNWKVRLYGTISRTPERRYSDYQRDAAHRVCRSDSALNSHRVDSQPRPSPRVHRSVSKSSHENKHEKRTVHFLEPEYKKKCDSSPSHPKLAAERAKLELYEVVCPANDIPRVIDIDYDTKVNRWCIDESQTFPDREDPVAMICSRSVLRAIQFAGSSATRSTRTSLVCMPQFQINRLPDYGVIKNPGGDLATLKTSSHDLFHIGNFESFLLHTHEYPQRVFLVDGGQYMKHWLIDLRQLMTVLSKPETRQICKSAFWDLVVHHGVAEKVTLQLWGAGDLQPETSTDIETLDWATWVRLYRNRISETLRRDLDRALGFWHPDTIPGSSWPSAVQPSLSIMSHKGLLSSDTALAEMRDGMGPFNIEPRSSSPPLDTALKEVKESNKVPTNASTIMEDLTSHDNDGPARVRTPFAKHSRIPELKRPLPQPRGPHPYPRSVIPPAGSLSAAFESQDLAADSDFTDIDILNEEDVSGTHRRALAEVDYGKETGGLVDPNKAASGVPVDERRSNRSLTRPLKGSITGTWAYERLKGHFKDQGFVESRKPALKLSETAASRHDQTMDTAPFYPAFSNQLDEAFAEKQRLIRSLTATQQDLEKGRQEWTKDQEILRSAGLLKHNLRVDLEEKWAASRLLEVHACLAQLDELCNNALERTKLSTEVNDSVKNRVAMARTQSMLDAVVVDGLKKLERTEQELAQGQRSLRPDLDKAECPKMLAHYPDHLHVVSEDAGELADHSKLGSMAAQDPEEEVRVSLTQPMRTSWTPDDDKTSFRLSTPQQTIDGLNKNLAACRSKSPTPDVQPHRGHHRPEIDPSPAPTTSDGSNISIFGSIPPRTDSKNDAGEANGHVGTESDKVSMCSDSDFRCVRHQADHLVSHLSADSLKLANNDKPPSDDGNPFDAVSDFCVPPDGTAAHATKLSDDVFVTGSDEPFVENAVERPENVDNDATTPDHIDRSKVADITRLATIDNDTLSDSEQPLEDVNIAGLEKVETKALLMSPTNLISHVRSSPSSSGRKKGGARKKWTRVQWVD